MRRDHPVAVALRVAAAAWAANLTAPVVGSKDTVSLRLDRKLQTAAVRFAVARRTEVPR